jgi:hypothetical protein
VTQILRHQWMITRLYRVFQKYIYNCIPEATVWGMLRKHLHLKKYKLSIVQGIERWIVYMPLCINSFVTLATQQHLEYHRKDLLKHPTLLAEVTLNRNCPR